MSRLRLVLGTALLILICAACGGTTDTANSDTNSTNNQSLSNQPLSNQPISATATPNTDVTAEATNPVAAEAASNASAEVVVVPTAAVPTGSSFTATGNEAYPPELPLNAQGVPLVARVNDVEITWPAFQRALSRRVAGTSAADYDVLAASELETLIEQVIIQQAAAELGISISDDDVTAEIEQQRSLANGQPLYDPTLYTEEEYREAQRAALLTGAVILAVTQSAEPVPQVRARHILVNTQDDAQAALDRLQNGEDFAALAAELSNDVTTRDAGGDLGWFIREDLVFTPELANAAFQMQPGQIAGPIPTQLGYHIIQVLEVGQREPGTGTEDPNLSAARFTAWLQAQFEQAAIERYLN
ncbi:MAG: peptidylprolyl isomerase [bacterium]|nr:peptidylprolyl isomerase [bacterium]